MSSGWINANESGKSPTSKPPEVCVEETKTLPHNISKKEFDFSEEVDSGKEVYCFFGLKGSGKTTNALSLPGKILALSFDDKTTIIKNNIYDNSDRSKVFNALKYYDEDNKIGTCERSYEYILAIIEKVGGEWNPDWILFDGGDELTTLSEMVMRSRNSITAYGGVSNLNVWKMRKALLEKVHKRAITTANKGIIYTLFTNKDELIHEGTTVMKSDVPKWSGIIMTHTDYVLRTRINYNKSKGKECLVEVTSSKNDSKLKTGDIIDTTNFKNKLIGD